MTRFAGPDEIKRREERALSLKQACASIEAEFAKRHEGEMKEYEEKLKEREAKGGKGKKPLEPVDEVPEKM